MSIPVTGFVDQNGAIRKYDYASLENVPTDLAKDADLDAVIAVQDTEPEDEKTKLWIKETASGGVQVPTYDEFLDSIVVARGTGTNSLIEIHTTTPNIASEASSVAIGGGNQSIASGAVTIGTNNIASAQNAVAIGSKLAGADPNTASAPAATALGLSCEASGYGSVAVGYNTTASNTGSFSSGYQTTSSGQASITSGYLSTASGTASAAIGYQTTASATGAAAVGRDVTASGAASTALGRGTTASASQAFAAGRDTKAEAIASTALGYGTDATGARSLVVGAYNEPDANDVDATHGAGTRKYLMIVGNGTADTARSNAATLDWNGNLEVAGDVVTKDGSFSELKSALFSNGTLALESGGIDSSSGGNVANSARLRTVNYTSQYIDSIVFDSSYYAYLYAYNIDGIYEGGYTGSGWSKDWQLQIRVYSPIILSKLTDCGYSFRIVFVRSDGSTPTRETLNLSTIINNSLQTNSEIYTVGNGYQFESFTEMLVALKDNANRKIVYIHGGEYDIFSEIGGAQYIASLDINGKNWRDVSNIVPPNTTIIGIGEVTLLWNPSDSDIIDNNHAFLFSPLNLSGSCTIENINIKCSNCRYGIHDETSGRTIYDNGIVRILKNVNVEYNESTYGTKYAYGAGHNKNSKYRYENCFFSAAYGDVWSMHDWATGNQTKYESSEFLFKNCVFYSNNGSGTNGIRFESSDLIGRTDDVKIVGSTFGRITFGTGGSTAIKQGYKVQTMLCPSYTVTYSSYIAQADRISPTNYLQIG